MCRSLDELIKSRSVHLNRYGLVSIHIKPQKHYLNMNPACSASLLMNDRCAVSFTAHMHTEARLMLAVFSASAVSLNEDINT